MSLAQSVSQERPPSHISIRKAGSSKYNLFPDPGYNKNKALVYIKIVLFSSTLFQRTKLNLSKQK